MNSCVVSESLFNTLEWCAINLRALRESYGWNLFLNPLHWLERHQHNAQICPLGPLSHACTELDTGFTAKATRVGAFEPCKQF